MTLARTFVTDPGWPPTIWAAIAGSWWFAPLTMCPLAW